jgi:hypothetical protein
MPTLGFTKLERSCSLPSGSAYLIDMGVASISTPLVPTSSEFRLANLAWIGSTTPYHKLNLSEESIAVLDLHGLEMHQLIDFFDYRNRATVIGFGDFEHIAEATRDWEGFNIAFLLRPENLSDEEAPSFVYEQLRSVYAPFQRAGVAFLSKTANSAPAGETMPSSKSHQLVQNIFGEQLRDVEPRTGEIAEEYMNPPFAFSADQQAALLRLVNQTETEVRSKDEED